MYSGGRETDDRVFRIKSREAGVSLVYLPMNSRYRRERSRDSTKNFPILEKEASFFFESFQRFLRGFPRKSLENDQQKDKEISISQ